MRTLVAPMLLLAQAVCAAQAPDEFRPVTWPEVTCAASAVPSDPARLPTAPRFGAAGASLLVPLGRDIAVRDKAQREAYAAQNALLRIYRGADCADGRFERWLEAHQKAFERRQKADLEPLGGPDAVTWADAAGFGRYEAEHRRLDAMPLADKLREACARPGPLPKISLPAGGEGVAGELAADGREFYRLMEALRAAHIDMMSGEQAFDCREVHEAYENLVYGQFRAFYARRDQDLARIGEEALTWRPHP